MFTLKNILVSLCALSAAVPFSYSEEMPVKSTAVFFVDESSTQKVPTGESWGAAFSSIEKAIEAAVEVGGGEIWVKSGTHSPAGNDRSASYRLVPGIKLYGGFRGDETRLDERNFKANKTVLSGDIGRKGSTSDNCYHVVTAASDCVIDGFVISKGNADGEKTDGFGAAVFFPSNTTGFIAANCTVEKNNAQTAGGMYIQSSSVILSNCTFYSNSAESGGALATSGKSGLAANDCTFSSSFAPESGGGCSLQPGITADFFNCTFLYNSTGQKGGAIYAEGGTETELSFSDCSFTGNSATESGGALSLSGTLKTVLANSTFTKNSSQKGAGAIGNSGGSTLTIADSSFVKNKAGNGKDDIENDTASSVVDATGQSLTITQNLKKRAEALALKKEQQEIVKLLQAPPKIERKLADVYVHNAEGIKVKLRSIVAGEKHTVLAFGDLTDPDFIESYRNIEAAAYDYSTNSIQFFYIYRKLAYPENNSYIKAFTEKERAQQAKMAAGLLLTKVPWLFDTMDNQAAKAHGTNHVENVYIFSADGTQEYVGYIPDEAALRAALAKIAGEKAQPTKPELLPAPKVPPVKLREAQYAERIILNPRKDKFEALQITPMESKLPFYVKLRAEGSSDLIKTGDGKFYLGFHIDPIYLVQWNNLEEPMKYAIQVPEGAAIAPSVGTAKRVAGAATDSEPREFLLEARKLDTTQPLTLQVSYSVLDPRTKKTIPVTQKYLIYLQTDLNAGRTFNRMANIGENLAAVAALDRQSPFSKMLAKLDIDRDGKLTEDEVPTAMRETFPLVDANSDGYVVEAEYTQFKQSQE